MINGRIVRKYNGRIQIRTSSSLHKALVKEADKEGVSLNLHINNLLSEKKGRKKVVRSSAQS